MNTEKECKLFFENLRKILFYVGHGKYNDYMTLEEVQAIKTTLEKILDVEKEYTQSTTIEKKNQSIKESLSIKSIQLKILLILISKVFRLF